MRKLLSSWLITGWVVAVILALASLAHIAFPNVITLDEGQQLWHVWAMFGGIWLSLPILLPVIFLPLWLFDR